MDLISFSDVYGGRSVQRTEPSPSQRIDGAMQGVPVTDAKKDTNVAFSWVSLVVILVIVRVIWEMSA